MKVEVVRRFHSGLQFDGNYVFSKTLTDFEGSQSQRTAYRDNQNRGLDKTYAGSDATHVFNANFIWEIPVGTGRKWMNSANPIVDGIFGGWQLNGICNRTSGFPLTMNSGYYKLTTSANSTVDPDRPQAPVLTHSKALRAPFSILRNRFPISSIIRSIHFGEML